MPPVGDGVGRRDGANGAAVLPADLSDVHLHEAPVLISVDLLLVEGLTDEEDDAFAAALDS